MKNPKIQTKELSLSKIKESKDNERHIPESAIEAVKKSIEAYGYNVPILVSSGMEIIAGHTRYKALQQLGIKKVTCVVVDEKDPKRLAKMRLLDNAISEASQWDSNKLEVELRGIYDLATGDSWNNFSSMFPDTSELDRMLNHSVGGDVKEVTQAQIDKVEGSKEDRYEKSDNKQEKMVACPNCTRKFLARIYDK